MGGLPVRLLWASRRCGKGEFHPSFPVTPSLGLAQVLSPARLVLVFHMVPRTAEPFRQTASMRWASAQQIVAQIISVRTDAKKRLGEGALGSQGVFSMCMTSLIGAGGACCTGLSFRGGNAPQTRRRAALHSICMAVANVGMLCFAEGGTGGHRRANVLRKSNTAMYDSSPCVGNLALSRLWRSRKWKKSFAVAARTRMDLSAVSFAVMDAPTYYRISFAASA